MDDGSLFCGPSGTSAGPQGGGRDEPRDCSGAADEHPSCVRQVVEAQTPDAAGSGPGSGSEQLEKSPGAALWREHETLNQKREALNALADGGAGTPSRLGASLQCYCPSSDGLRHFCRLSEGRLWIILVADYAAFS